MSEPLSAVEIEDVLSSIRRLVSEDLRPAARGVPTVAPSMAGSALILTPALRVVHEAGPLAAPVVLPRAMAASDMTAPDAGDSIAIETLVARVGAALADRDDDRETETGDAVPEPDPAWEAGRWSPAGSDDDRIVDVDADVEAGAGVASDAAFVHGETGTEHGAGWAQVGADDSATSTAHSIPDAIHADAGWADEATAEIIAELEQPEPVGARPDLANDAAEMSFDEEVLRDLVRDLIREELQGHLGERITRNIRKLVRAEIARALAAAEFE
jgi:hypothetical protein